MLQNVNLLINLYLPYYYCERLIYNYRIIITLFRKCSVLNCYVIIAYRLFKCSVTVRYFATLVVHELMEYLIDYCTQ